MLLDLPLTVDAKIELDVHVIPVGQSPPSSKKIVDLSNVQNFSLDEKSLRKKLDTLSRSAGKVRGDVLKKIGSLLGLAGPAGLTLSVIVVRRFATFACGHVLQYADRVVSSFLN